LVCFVHKIRNYLLNNKHGFSVANFPTYNKTTSVFGLAYKKDSLRLTDIANELQMRPGSANKLVNQLVTLGHLTRREDANDRRVKNLSLTLPLTKAGEQFVETTEPKLRAYMQPLLADASSKDIAGYLKTLSSIRDNAIADD
jgi:DNA-binding MarR family transcriptional regulator